MLIICFCTHLFFSACSVLAHELWFGHRGGGVTLTGSRCNHRRLVSHWETATHTHIRTHPPMSGLKPQTLSSLHWGQHNQFTHTVHGPRSTTVKYSQKWNKINNVKQIHFYLMVYITMSHQNRHVEHSSLLKMKVIILKTKLGKTHQTWTQD